MVKNTDTMWMNGEFISAANAQFEICTHALHYGTSVYEGIRSYAGKAFKVREHYARFLRSAELIGFTIPHSITEMISATQTLLKQYEDECCYIRPIAWCGSNKISVSHNNCEINTAIMVWPRISTLDAFIADKSAKGANLNVASWRRPDPKSFPVQSKAAANYAISAFNKSKAENEGFDDALTLDCNDNIAEATSSNIFFVDGETLITPTPESFLNGITRQTCLEIARTANIKCCERSIKMHELQNFSEAFLTGTAVEILPINSIKVDNDIIHFPQRKMSHTIAKLLYEDIRTYDAQCINSGLHTQHI